MLGTMLRFWAAPNLDHTCSTAALDLLLPNHHLPVRSTKGLPVKAAFWPASLQHVAKSLALRKSQRALHEAAVDAAEAVSLLPAALSPVRLLLCWPCSALTTGCCASCASLPLNLGTGVAGALRAAVSRCVSTHLPQGGKTKADATSPPSKTPLSPPSLGPAGSAAALGDTAQAAAPGSGKDGGSHRAGVDEGPLSKSPLASPEAELSLAKVAGQSGGSPLPPGGLEVEPEFAAALR